MRTKLFNMKRQINTEQFRKLVDAVGERALAKLSYEAKCGHSTLEQMYRGTYGSSPSDSLRERICLSLQKLLKKSVKEDLVFPLVAASKEAAS